MKKLLDKTLARQLLSNALEDAKSQNYTAKTTLYLPLFEILTHNHLTYKYILLNALLAKATDKTINPLALQDGSQLTGSYDARSFCHQIIVPFERESLQNRLGGSNEPFLNKPARFPELSMNNAVRRGKDKETLSRLINLLVSDELENNAYAVLRDALNIILSLPTRSISMPEAMDLELLSKQDISKFLEDLIQVSNEGETLTLFVIVYFEIWKVWSELDLEIRSHPVNQSGSSSKQLADIEVFDRVKSDYQFLIEVKDKAFTFGDVEHAILKCLDLGHKKLTFIMGPRAHNVDPKMSNEGIENYFAKRGCVVNIVSSEDMLASFGLIYRPLSPKAFFEMVNKHIQAIKPKTETLTFTNQILRKNFGKEGRSE